MLNKISKKELKILFECWVKSNSQDEYLNIVKNRLPNFSLILAVNVMRKMIAKNKKWKNISIQKREKRKKDKIIKKQERELKRQERESRKKRKEEKKIEKCRLDEIYEKLDSKEHYKRLNEKISSDFFFCSEINQCSNYLFCIFRIFSKEYMLTRSGKCAECKKMDKYISVIEEIINGK